MKVICDCGAKYALDATPDMLRNPPRFACPSCNADLSARLLDLARQELGNAVATQREGLAPAPEIAPPPPSAAKPIATSVAPPPTIASPKISVPAAPTTPAVSIPSTPRPAVIAQSPIPTPTARVVEPVIAPPPAPIPSPVAPPPPAPPPVPTARLHRSTAPAANAATPDVQDTRFCAKHPQQRVTETCRVCEKPICPKCMALFGYVCSVHCREKAEANGIELPVFAGQRDVAARKEGKKLGRIISLIAVGLVIFLGAWIWLAWFGSRPHAAFAIRFEESPAMSGTSAFCPDHQIVFIHGGKLARYDLKSKKEVWLNQIVDAKKIGQQAEAEVKQMQAEAAKGEYSFRIPSVEKHTKDIVRSAERNLELLVLDKNIWVANGNKVTRYDWDSGQVKQEIDFARGFERAKRVGDEMETRQQINDHQLAITRFNLVTGEVKKSEIGTKPTAQASTNTNDNTNKNTKAIASTKTNSRPATDANGRRQLDPQKLADAVANAPYAAKIAAPATLSVALNQQRAMNFMDEMDGKLPPGVPKEDAYKYRTHSEIIARREGVIRFSVRMLEENIIERNAMKSAPKKSALNENLSVTGTATVANELLNEMQRNAGGGTVREDHSRYLVRIYSGDNTETPDWEGEVIGEPSIFPQPSVTIVTGGKTLIVLDKSNKKKWESTLNYPIASRRGMAVDDEQDERAGLGPVVERGNTLFVFDQGVLSAFELSTGNARWRLPSVGISGMFFDDGGDSIYVNTTTASPEQIKYSKQIDVSNKTSDVILKLDAKTGKEIWSRSTDGVIAYLEGKFIYTVSFTGPLDDDEEISPEMAALGVQTSPYVRIRRINPKNGQVLWDHFQQRGALDVKIHENTFQIVFKKEVQVLKFIAF